MAKDEMRNEPAERPAEVAEFWSNADIDPIEVALPSGVGLTLRHYRTVMVTPEPDNDDDDVDVLEPNLEAEDTKPTGPLEPEEREDVLFLSHRNKVLLFKTEKGLIDFVRSNTKHGLSDIESFSTVRKNLTEELLVPAPEDMYELDLVVKNLRGGHTGWDADLLVSAGEIARDIAQACHLQDVLSALGPGSPLDDLDEALRDGGFWARRRLRKIGEEMAALAWRGVIGKLTNAIEWRD